MKMCLKSFFSSLIILNYRSPKNKTKNIILYVKKISKTTNNKLFTCIPYSSILLLISLFYIILLYFYCFIFIFYSIFQTKKTSSYPKKEKQNMYFYTFCFFVHKNSQIKFIIIYEFLIFQLKHGILQHRFL